MEIADELDDLNHNDTYPKVAPVRKSFISDLFIVLMLCYRYFHLFLFNPLTLIALLMCPTLNVVSFHYFKQDLPSQVPIGIVIDNQTIDIDLDLLKDHNISLDEVDCIHPRFYSQYVDSKVINLISFDNFEKAMLAANKTKVKGVVRFNQNFVTGYFAKLVSIPTEVDNEDVENSKITFRMDTVSRPVSDAVEAFLLKAYRDYWINSERCLGIQPLSLDIIKIEDSLVGHVKFDDHGGSHVTVFSLVFIVPFTCSMFIAGMAFINEIKDEGMQRYLSAGLTSRKMYFAQYISNLILLGFSAILSLFSARAITGLKTDGSMFLASLLVLCQVTAGIFFGQAVALIFKSQVFVIIFVLGISYTAFATQGFYVPLESQPLFARFFTKLLPMARPLISLKAILFGEHDLNHHFVWEGFLVNLIYIIAFALVSFLLFHKYIHASSR